MSGLKLRILTMTDEIVPGLVPGSFVRNPAQPDWGLGQVQSVIGARITVNFEHAGKLSINGENVKLEVIDSGAD
jgi:hypothetical protein